MKDQTTRRSLRGAILRPAPEFAIARYSPNTTTPVGEPFSGIEPPLLPEATATYCLLPRS